MKKPMGLVKDIRPLCELLGIDPEITTGIILRFQVGKFPQVEVTQAIEKSAAEAILNAEPAITAALGDSDARTFLTLAMTTRGGTIRYCGEVDKS